MALRFQKRIKIAPGVRVNLSKSGISTTVGPQGLSVNTGKDGTFLNAGLPGTGLSTRTKLSAKTTPPQDAPTTPDQRGANAANLVVGLIVIGAIGALAYLIF